MTEDPRVKPRALVRFWPALAVGLLSWPAISYLFWPGYVSTYDGIYHLTRMIELDSLVRQGLFYPRWFPDFGQGHGYPIFNFFPPFAYLLSELPALIVRDLPLAIQVSMAASVVVSGWGMYLLARELGAGRLASLAVATFYVYFPYHVQDIYTRGGMPELWSMAWLPWLVWAQVRAACELRMVWLACAGIFGALEIGTHNILAVFILPLSLAVSLAYAHLKRQSIVAALGCSALSLLLAAGYWLPAVVEAPLTHVRQLAGDWLPDHTYDVAQLLDGAFYAPYGGKVFKMTGLEAAIVVALLLIVAWRALRFRRWLPEATVAALMLLALFGLTRWSIPIWTNLPLLGFIQFPWRLLMLVGFLAALMLAIVGSWRRWTWPGLAALVVLVAAATLAQVPYSRFALPSSLDARSLESQEYGSALDGVAIESEYQPQTSSPDLMKASQGKRLPSDDIQTPPIQVRNVAFRPTGIHADVTADQASRIRLQTLFFPGWSGRIDGRDWPLRPATPAGFIEADVPPGSHTFDVSYDGTRLEGLAGIVSGVTLLGLAGWLSRRHRLALACIIAAGAAIAAAAVRPPALQSAMRPAEWTPSSEQTLVGSGPVASTEQGLDIDLVWLFHAPREATFDFVLRDAGSRIVRRNPSSQATVLRYEYVAANELLRRHYRLSGFRDLPPGTYNLALQAGGSSFDLGSVTLLSDSGVDHPLDALFGEGALLSDYSVHRVQRRPGLITEDLPTRADAALNPGDFLLVALEWQSRQGIDQNYVTFVHLLDADGKAWAVHDNQPNATLQATSSWVPGQAIPDRFLLRLPDDAPPGIYRLEVGLYHIHESGYEFLPLRNGGNSVLFGAIKVRARTAATPAGQPLATWSDGFALERWRSARDGQNLALTFDWRALGTVTRDYTLFVHLSDAFGRPVAQADSPPQGGSYRTGLWEPGDEVADTHVAYDVPPGRYRLSIGWYLAGTGERLKLANGTDELDLGDVEVA